MSFVYPYGSTLNVAKPAIPILSSGYVCYPLNRPIAACWTRKGAGRLVVFGSSHVFDDAWIDEEENSKLQEVLFKWIQGEFNMDQIDAETPDLSDPHTLPNTEELAERLRTCLQDTEELPKSPLQLFDDQMFRYDVNLLPEILDLYENLGVKHEMLNLIAPQFEVPLPPLTPAVFPPILNELPAPPLELFDLDEQFASEKVRLAYLTNLCTEEDIDYYVREAGQIMGVPQQIKQEKKTAKQILEFVFKQVVNWKKINQEPPMDVNIQTN